MLMEQNGVGRRGLLDSLKDGLCKGGGEQGGVIYHFLRFLKMDTLLHADQVYFYEFFSPKNGKISSDARAAEFTFSKYHAEGP